MNKDWTAYDDATHKLQRANRNRSKEFRKLFKAGDEVKYQRQSNGKVHVGHILEVHSCFLRLRVANIETGSEYWIDGYWLVKGAIEYE